MVQHGSTSIGKVRRWLALYSEYVELVERIGSLPTATPSTSDPNQVRLAYWARYQRRRFLNGTILAWQKDLMEEIPDFSWEDRWTLQLHRLVAFLADHHRMPSYRSADLTERRLASWVHKQRHLHRAGRLSHDRIQALRRLDFKIL